MAPVSHLLHSLVAQDSLKKLLNLILLTKLPLILGVCQGGLSQGSVLDLSEALLSATVLECQLPAFLTLP